MGYDKNLLKTSLLISVAFENRLGERVKRILSGFTPSFLITLALVPELRGGKLSIYSPGLLVEGK